MNFTSADVASGKYYFLDMGTEKYGDCILCVFGNITVLIDGGHLGDYDGQANTPSIPDQIAAILGQRPSHVSLLVVTHCHSDHIGCLPEMVANGDLTADWALVADENLGFARSGGPDSAAPAVDAAAPEVRSIIAALREEDRTDMPAADLARFLQDAATVEQRYRGMLRTLSERGTRVVRYGRDAFTPVMEAFANVGLRVLGPTRDHLLICAEAIDRSARDILERIGTRADAAADPVRIYRALAQSESSSDDIFADRPGKGAALNDQSIVLRLGGPGEQVLLAGDMQFAAPEVAGLDDHMTSLRRKTAQAGPYVMVKLTHHTSYNGVSEEVLEDYPGTVYFAHTGGSNDTTHPDREVLEMLAVRADSIQFARTDRNGVIEFDPRNGFTVERGELNDFAANLAPRHRRPDEAAATAETPISFRSARAADGVIELIARIPVPERTLRLTLEGRMSLTISSGEGSASPREPSREEEPRDRRLPRPPPPPIPRPPEHRGLLAGGRALPPLLFVTNSHRLRESAGDAAVDALTLIRHAGQTLYDATSGDPMTEVRAQLDQPYAGVVIVGGYNVLPSQRLDVLTSEIRTQLGRSTTIDDDNFVVWNDEIYGDIDNDGQPELPVSRIPDAGSAALLTTALSASSGGSGDRFGIHNRARPFANLVWARVPGSRQLYASGPLKAAGVDSRQVTGPFVYMMLHGSDSDSSRFWGENPGAVEAFNVDKVPQTCSGVVFTGCCWGALTVKSIASRHAGGSVPSRTIGESLALSFLQAGVLAYVGCTGTHYSPDATGGFAGGPMHLAFFDQLVTHKRPPAETLFQARIEYLRGMPHGRTALFDLAIERKILKQFTCLGLGW